MAYSTIDKSTSYFNTVTYSGTGSAQSITGVGFRPDWLWIKHREDVSNHKLQDAIRGSTKVIGSNETSAEATVAQGVTSFDSDGFSLGTDASVNGTGAKGIVAWNWLAGGTAPAITYSVKVVSDSGNKYRFDDFGTSAVTLDLQEGGTYTFDQSDSSNAGHPLRFYTASDKSGGEYTTGVTTNGTPVSSGAYTRITVAASAPTLYYQCSAHAGMGGQANTNSTFGSSNFSGSIQSTVSANTTAGFSIVSYTGTGSAQSMGHGLGSTPKIVIVKSRTDASTAWIFYTTVIDGSMDTLALQSTNGKSDSSTTVPASSVFYVPASSSNVNTSSKNYIAYCFAEKKGYSKFGTYTGNGNSNGTFIYTGFKPSWILIKQTSGTNLQSWWMIDAKRDPYNVCDENLRANGNAAASESYDMLDIVSNGFKTRWSDTAINGSGVSYIYMAFGQTIVGSNNVPATAR